MADNKHPDGVLYVLDRVSASEALAREQAQLPPVAFQEGDVRDLTRDDSALVFRIGEEWLALSTGVVNEVAGARAIHSLPHQRNRAILGVLNIRGGLRICVSLARLFQIDDGGAKPAAQHLLVAMHEGQTLVFPVDEVAGVHRYHDEALSATPTTLAHAATQYTRGLVDWRGRKVGLLDHDLLFYALNRSMT
ncbi:chemotaxis protein CheW [Herbaspirillum sp. LeCh32-8]|uniref:chemotaxis protein CheW n=1 Tax=Herbaspirillum sp. LeCh32-8 TaxID=2821356 RepID=UPI001AE670FB|nr:chemotaxis protein CheW [Herbaspirillum sp. LeCh32-8]MBP0599663.1 chemotaxis protein CheW [Herbaspirillum sp. LeCh32-8]